MNRLCIIVLALVAASSGAGAASLPAQLGLPPDAKPSEVVAYDFAVGRFAMADGTIANKRGHFWSAAQLAHPAFTDAETALAHFRQALEGAGWRFVGGTPAAASFTRPHGDTEQWLSLSVSADASGSRLQLVEMAPQALRVTLPTPGPVAAMLTLNQDLPYLPALPDATLRRAAPPATSTRIPYTMADGQVFDVAVDTVREYDAPTRAAVQTYSVYGVALKNAGWQVRNERCADDNEHCGLIAYWRRDGRNLWLAIDAGPGEYRVSSGTE